MSILSTRPLDRTKPVLGDFVSMDRNRRLLLFTGESMEIGWKYTHMRWMQDEPSPNADPNMFDLATP